DLLRVPGAHSPLPVPEAADSGPRVGDPAGDAAPDSVPPRASRGRRSGVVGPDPDAVLLEAVKAAPRRSSIIKVKSAFFRCSPPPTSESSGQGGADSLTFRTRRFWSRNSITPEVQSPDLSLSSASDQDQPNGSLCPFMALRV
uniref:Uncharacterized protein n=1 Tax=Oryzias sinensis TaxID=183150 RepID=A0A8C8DF27_9TELE